MDPVQLLRGLFLLAASTVLFVNFIPALRNRFLVYGSRATPILSAEQIAAQADYDLDHKPVESRYIQTPESPHELFVSCLDHIAAYNVPHSNFEHFYGASVIASFFWAFQYYFQGRLFLFVTSHVKNGNIEASMSSDQVLLAWTLMTIQGMRRLYESIAIAKPSPAKMSFIHWVLGIAFYLAINIAIWIEGTPVLRNTKPSISNISFSAPTIRTFLTLPLFVLASGIQYDCHSYLASLPKYTLPVHPVFQHLIYPHYTAECIIYISLAFLAAPKGEMLNKTIVTALIFVAINLGVTAESGREWYVRKFGADSVKDRWRMIPYVY
ncbi:MAG: hypothetical protein M1827_004802 [Pycnora praestabilis]|nr:MAG: hypothetical protein M1827_004802 [Pycnora praestabilis]